MTRGGEAVSARPVKGSRIRTKKRTAGSNFGGRSTPSGEKEKEFTNQFRNHTKLKLKDKKGKIPELVHRRKVWRGRAHASLVNEIARVRRGEERRRGVDWK